MNLIFDATKINEITPQNGHLIKVDVDADPVDVLDIFSAIVDKLKIEDIIEHLDQEEILNHVDNHYIVEYVDDNELI
jgi:hypothetical protein